MVLCDRRGSVLDVNACLTSKFFHDQVDKSHFTGRHLFDLGLIDLGRHHEEFLKFLDGLCIHMPEVAIPASAHRAAGVANMRGIPLVNDRNEVEGGVVFIEDVTEIRETQRAMLQAAKMAAVGQMTLGFAHEIGTPLGIIMANAQFMLQDRCCTCDGAEELSVILSETNRITNLIQHLLIFSRPAKFRRQSVSVNDLVREVVALMKTQEIMDAIEVVADLPNDIPKLRVEATLIKQVFFNLVLNASQAMPNGGMLTITSRLAKSQPVGESRAPHVEIAFTDTGEGISAKNLRRIFTPFFTTKETGKGTGLGLSVSYRIVQNHGGTIMAESPGEGQGASFRVYLPLAGPPEIYQVLPPGGGETDE
jgi:signal transduction histidine kinase